MQQHLDVMSLDALVPVFAKAQRILFITGAGLSADSGLPTYRGIGGLYEDRLTEEEIPIELALSGRMLQERPDIVWGHLARIEAACRGAGPNAAHHVIAAFEAARHGSLVLTQNVDGLHRAAGARRVIEVHGTLHDLHCTACSWEAAVDDYAELPIPPACPDCEQLVRPRVVLFGENLPDGAIRSLENALGAGVDLVVSIGTTSVFPYISGPVWWARQAGIPTVEINPGDTTVSDIVDIRVRAGAAATLSHIARALSLSGF